MFGITKAFYPYIAGAVLVALLAGGTLAYQKGHKAGEADGKALVAESTRKAYESQMAALVAEAALAKKINTDLLDRLGKVPASTHTQEIIRANPTDCVLPGVVSDSLRDQASRSNATRSPR